MHSKTELHSEKGCLWGFSDGSECLIANFCTNHCALGFVAISRIFGGFIDFLDELIPNLPCIKFSK